MVLMKAQRLQRLAEKLGRIESRLAGAEGELEAVDAVEDELREAAARTGVELTAVRRLDAATLERALWAGGQPDPGRLWTAAEVLRLDALRADRKSEPAVAEDRLRKARRLYARAAETAGLELPADAPSPAERLREVDERLGPGD